MAVFIHTMKGRWKIVLKNKKTRIENITIDPSKRLLFMSDIHGDIKVFKEALTKVNFSSDDYLFVIGDMIEKGDFLDNVAMLDYIIYLSKLPNVYFLAGNCDEVLRFILPPVDKEKFLYFALNRKKSIINDLAYKLDYPLTSNMDIDAFIALIVKKYPQYFEFIDSLADVIIINDELILVHGGILDINNIPKNSIDILKLDRFKELSPHQPKTMIVGHYPTRNYCLDIPSSNPIFDFSKNIICIDGGNNVTKGGQINVVILESLKSQNYSFEAFDHYEKYLIKDEIYYERPLKNYNIRFGKNEIEIIKKDLDFYLVKPVGKSSLMWVNQDFIFNSEGKYYCYEGSDNFLNLHKGDIVSIILKGMPYTLVKHEGVIGLIESKYIYEN